MIPKPLIPLDQTLIAQIIREKIKAQGPYHVWYADGHGAAYCTVDPNGIDEAAEAIVATLRLAQEAVVLR